DFDLHSFPTRRSSDLPGNVFYFGWNNYHPAEDKLLEKLGYNSLSEIEGFYFLQHSSGDKMLVPQYLFYLNGPYRKIKISKNKAFELLYFYKEQNVYK